MSLKATIRNVNNVSIIDLSGKITLGENTGVLRDSIKSVNAQGNKNIILNLADVSYVDSAGLGELVGSFTTAKNQGGMLKLLNAQKKIKDLLQLTKLYTVFQAYDNEDEAIKSFGSATTA